jgi:hypothetical protein
MKEPKPMQEVHEWRHKIQEEDKRLSRRERIEKTRRIAEEVIRRYGSRSDVSMFQFPNKRGSSS